MKGLKTLFSKKSDHWSTPPETYAALDREFRFNFDPCPLNANFDGLLVPWRGRVFVNPPYSNISAFLAKARQELGRGASVCVFLIPARTDTKWFHEYIYNKSEIRFIKGRLKFGDSKNSAPFPSMICILKKEEFNAVKQ